jgi:predicted nucleotidyltransferase
MRDDPRMVRLDDRLPPVAFDDAARARLSTALDRNGVVVAYLFGSQATGRAGPLSDVDVAVVFDGSLDERARFDLQLRVREETVAAVRHDSVDVAVLNGASPLLRHRVVRDGRVLVDRDPLVRVRFEARAILDYLDTAPLRAELARGLRHRLDEGRFGRS